MLLSSQKDLQDIYSYSTQIVRVVVQTLGRLDLSLHESGILNANLNSSRRDVSQLIYTSSLDSEVVLSSMGRARLSYYSVCLCSEFISSTTPPTSGPSRLGWWNSNTRNW